MLHMFRVILRMKLGEVLKVALGALVLAGALAASQTKSKGSEVRVGAGKWAKDTLADASDTSKVVTDAAEAPLKTAPKKNHLGENDRKVSYILILFSATTLQNSVLPV